MIMPYLNFNNCCEEAFQWYKQIFDGKSLHMSRYGDIPDKINSPYAEQPDQNIMHAQLMLHESSGISGADVPFPVPDESRIQLQVHFDTSQRAELIFTALAEGGTIVAPLASNPPPDDQSISGMVADKYGFQWIVSASKN